MKSDDIKGYLYLGGAVVAAYFVYKTVTGVSGAVKAVDGAVSGTVGGIGSVFGLPTPDQTIDDPVVVRHIIDTQGYFEASKQGTAMAFLKALGLPAESTSSGVVNQAGSVVSETANMVGGWFGLPTSGQTIDDPVAVRYIIDTEGSYAASQKGTASAYIKALAMPAGSGTAQGSAFTPAQISNIGASALWTPTITPTGSILAGPSFTDTASGNWSWF